MQIPGLYALSGVFFALALVSFYVFAVNLSHLTEMRDTSTPFVALGIIISVGFLIASFIVFLKAQRNKSNPVTISFVSKRETSSESENSPKTEVSSREIKIEGKDFNFSMQWTTALMFLSVPIGDAAVGGLSWVGGVAIGLAFLFLFVCFYGIYSAVSKSTQNQPAKTDN